MCPFRLTSEGECRHYGEMIVPSQQLDHSLLVDVGVHLNIGMSFDWMEVGFHKEQGPIPIPYSGSHY